jgi:hypothetical protein
MSEFLKKFPFTIMGPMAAHSIAAEENSVIEAQAKGNKDPRPAGPI